MQDPGDWITPSGGPAAAGHLHPVPQQPPGAPPMVAGANDWITPEDPGDWVTPPPEQSTLGAIARTAVRSPVESALDIGAGAARAVGHYFAPPEIKAEQFTEPTAKAIEATKERVGEAIPIDPQREKQLSVRITGMAGSALPYLAATVVAPTAVAGAAGAAMMGAAQSYEGTYEAAKAKGADDETAHRAASGSALVNAGLMTVPVAAVFNRIPLPIQNQVLQRVSQYVVAGGAMMGLNEAQKLTDNLVAQQTFDPERNTFDGMGHDLVASLASGMALHGVTQGPRDVRDAYRALRNPAAQPTPQAPAQGQATPAAEPQQAAAQEATVDQTPPAAAKVVHPATEPVRDVGHAAAPEVAQSLGTLPQQVVARGASAGGADVLASHFSPVEREMLGEAGIRPTEDPDGRAIYGTVTLLDEARRRAAAGTWDTALPLDDQSHIAAWKPAEQAPGVHITTPERPADIAAQIGAMVDPASTKDAVFVAAGNGQSIPERLPPAVRMVQRPEGTLLTTNPQKAAIFRTTPRLTEAHMAQILGYPESKPEAMASGAPQVVQAVEPSGAVAAAAVTSPPAAAATEAAIAAQAPGARVETVAPEQAQAQRAESASPATPTFLGREWLQGQMTNEKGFGDLRVGASKLVSQVQQALDSGQSVIFHPEPGRDVQIVATKDGMMQDAQGLRWGTMVIATDGTGKVGVEIQPRAAEAPAAQNLTQNIPENIPEAPGTPVPTPASTGESHGNPPVAPATPLGARRAKAVQGWLNEIATAPDRFDRMTAFNQLSASVGKDGGASPEQVALAKEATDKAFEVATAEPAPAAEQSRMVEHVTRKGKTIRGVVRKDLTLPQAREIDPFTFKKDDGWFIREERLHPVEKASAAPAEPTEAQAKAGNYQMGHLSLHGLDVTVETPRGGVRRGPIDEATGKPRWETVMPADYGYLKGTKGKDGDHIDVTLGPRAAEMHDLTKVEVSQMPTFVIDQIDPATRKFDEHKTFVGFSDEAAALAAYDGSFSDGSGPSRRGAVKEMPFARFKDWVENGNHKRPLSYKEGAPPHDWVKPAEEGRDDLIINGGTRGVFEWRDVGKNAAGNTVYEDGRGVRSYVENGVRVTEPVAIIPGHGLRIRAPADKASEFQTVHAGERAPPPAATPVPETPNQAPAAAPAPTHGATNRVFTADAAAAARARLREKLGRLNAGLDPEMMLDGITLAGFHIEAGARDFASYAHALLSDLGEAARPYLRQWYESVRWHPGFDTAGMSSHEEIGAELQRAAEQPISPPEETEHGDQGAVPHGDAGAGPEDVHGAAPGGDAGPAPAAGGGAGEPDAARPPGPGAKGEGRPPNTGRGARSRGNRPRNPDRVPSPEGPTDAGAAGRPADERPDANVRGENFRIEPGALEETRSPRTKARDNLAAIELAQRITADGREATVAEQAILAKYVGWGGLPGAFEHPKTGKFGEGLEEIGARLRDVLPKDQYEAARGSTQFAHYTAEHVIRSMWDAVRRMGFKGGDVLEPGMGVGHFLGLMPGDLAEASRYQGIEMDAATASIAKLLYPRSGVRQADFIRTPIPEAAFDLAIGNPPFSDTVISADPKYAARRFMLHDYFFAKTIDSVRPGGLLAFVTSAGTMNKLDDSARRYLAERAEFVGGVRLPSTAFKRNAGTEVTTDILFFRRHPEGRIALGQGEAPAWAQTVQRTLPNREGAQVTGNVSRYFSDHPDQVLGREGFFDKLVAQDRYAVHAEPGASLETTLRDAVQRLPENIMTEPETVEQRAERDFASGQTKDGSFYVAPDGRLMQYRGGSGAPVQIRGKGVAGGLTKAEAEQVRQLVPIRDALRDVFRADLARDEAAGAVARAALNKHYDQFVAQHGPINKAEFTYKRPTAVQQEEARGEAREESRAIGDSFDDGDFDPTELLNRKATLTEIARARQQARDEAARAGRPFNEGTFDPSAMPDVVTEKRPNIKAFMQDPESYRLRSIERYDDATGSASKRAIFERNILAQEREPEIRSAQDGVLWSLNKVGRFDLDQIAAKMGRSPEDIVKELGDGVYRVPGAGHTYQTSDEYLSGDVVSKLEEARARLLNDPSLQRNIDALTKAIPPPLSPGEIKAEIGMPWIPIGEVYDFVNNHMRIGAPEIRYAGAIGTWVVSPHEGRWGVEAPDLQRWGTPDKTAYELLSDVMNRVTPKIYRQGADKKAVFDPVATQAVQDRMDEIKQAFRDWTASDVERGDRIAHAYNDTMNRVVPRAYDGAYLTTPGVAADWSWRPHQTRVVARIIQTGNTYMAHAVGAGKTSAMIGAGMEMRRLGLVKKPMYVVPNHMLAQFAKEFYEQYPTARISVADEENFHTDTRRQFVSNVSQEDLDAVIITHSGFKKIPISDEFERHIVQEQIGELTEALAGLDKFGDRITVKKLENQKAKLEQRVSAMNKGAKDKTLTFEEMGVDFLFVDEAHGFRKLSFATKMGNIKGVAPEGSDMAWDLYGKVRYLETQKPGRAAAFASGTPITNTMGELYSISRYLQPDALRKYGVSHFDSWVQSFADTKTSLEQTPAGNYAPMTRLRNFLNVHELFKMVAQVMDIVTPAQLEQYVTRPKLRGGQRQPVHLAPRTETIDAYQATLEARMDAIKARKGPPKKGDDIILSVINDGRHASIDPRFVETAQSDPRSKLNQMLDNVVRIHRETANQQFYTPASGYKEPAFRGPATQMIFANLGVNPRGPMGFSGYRWMKSYLIREGIPEREIAFIGDYESHVARQRLFNDVNEGKVRVLIGSTQKMGTGVNAQRRLIAIHNQDPLWFPADDEQRNGRMLRQGNMNPEVEIHDYSTKATYDAVMWDMMASKGRFIEQFFRGDPNLRSMEDIGEASMYEQAAGMATTDPRVMQLTELRQSLEKAERRSVAHDREQYDLRRRAEMGDSTANFYQQRADIYAQDIATRQDTRGDKFSMTVAGDEFTKRKDAADALVKAVNAAVPELADGAAPKPIGAIAGFKLGVAMENKKPSLFLLTHSADPVQLSTEGEGGSGAIKSAEYWLRELDHLHAKALDAVETHRRTAEQARSASGRRFEGQPEIDDLRGKVRQLDDQLRGEARAREQAANGQTPQEPPRRQIQGPADDAVRDVLAAAHSGRVVAGPHVKVEVAPGDTIEITEPDGTKTLVNGYAIGRLIRAASGANLEHTLNHEAVHALRLLDVISPDEWSTLTAAARRGGWVEHYGVAGLYPEEEHLHEEEAIAQRFADWQTGRVAAPEGVLGRIWAGVSQFFERLGNRLQGRGFQGAEDVFTRMRSGEIGRRTPRDDATIEQSIVQAARYEPALRERASALRAAESMGTLPGPAYSVAVQARMALGKAAGERMQKARDAADEIKMWFSPTSREGARPMELTVRRHAAELAQSTGQSFHALDAFRTAVGRLSPAAQMDVTDRAEAGRQQATPELQAAMDALRAEQAKWLNKIRSLGKGLLEQARENYMGHIWGNYQEWVAGQQQAPDPDAMRSRAIAAGLSKRPIAGSGNFLKQRVFDTQADGIAAGLVPVTTNPIELQLIKLREMQKFYHANRMADELKASGIAKWVPYYDEGGARAAGLEKLDDGIFQPRHFDEETFGRIEAGNWYAPNGAALVFNNYVSRGIAQKYPTIYGSVRVANNALNLAQLGLSGFHATFVANDMVTSRVALGIQQMWNKEFARGATTAAVGLGAWPFTIVRTLKTGAALGRAYLDPQNATPEVRTLAQAMTAAGGRAKMETWYQTSETGSFFKTLADLKNPGSALAESWQILKGSPLTGVFKVAARVLDTIGHPLMAVIVPNAKMGVFADLAKDWLRRNPAATETQVSEAMTHFWDSVDNRMGQMVHDNVFWHRTMKDLAFISSRSVGWNLGTIREIGGGMVDGASMINDIARGRPTDLSTRMAYVLAMPVVTGAFGAALTYMATGGPPDSLFDYFFPPTGTETNGVKDRRIIPGYMKDVFEYARAPVQTLLNKTSPLLSTLNELRQNRDYYGGIINMWGHDNPMLSYPEFLANQMLPFSIRGWWKENAAGASLLDQSLNFWGIQPAPASIVNPERGAAFEQRQDVRGLRARERENAKGRLSFQ